MGGAAESRGKGAAGALEAGEAEALEALRTDWSGAWDIGCGDTRWQAASRDGTGHVLTRASAAGLALALRISHGRHPR
jgi:hypothetical protein